MIYKFKSKAAGNLLMTGDVGDRLLRIIGKDVTAQGIIEATAIPRAVHALEAAVAEDESRLAKIKGKTNTGNPEPIDADPATLRQHAWPLIEMMKRAQAAGEAIVWGV
jgi:Domain of unknown function (DUF1840)